MGEREALPFSGHLFCKGVRSTPGATPEPVQIRYPSGLQVLRRCTTRCGYLLPIGPTTDAQQGCNELQAGDEKKISVVPFFQNEIHLYNRYAILYLMADVMRRFSDGCNKTLDYGGRR